MDDPDCGHAGEICGVKLPDAYMTQPPLTWQTFDVQFKAAKFDERGRDVIDSARITVYHNGVLIHDNFGLAKNTGEGFDEGPEPGPLYFQDKRDQVFYRNVWVKEGFHEPPVGIKPENQKSTESSMYKIMPNGGLEKSNFDLMGRFVPKPGKMKTFP